MSDSVRPHGLQPNRLLRPWDFPGKSTGVGCHCLLRERERERETHTHTHMLSYIISLLIHVTHLSYVDCDSVSLVVVLRLTEVSHLSKVDQLARETS